MVKKNLIIGVLSIQGNFFEHIKVLEKLRMKVKEVRLKEDLDGIDGLIIPGGESTTMNIFLQNKELKGEIIRKIKKEMPVFGTCAGAILLADTLSLIDIRLERNAYGSQLDSFEEEILLNLHNKKYKINGVFIRAPKIIELNKKIRVLARNKNDNVVMARKNNILIATFHPELTDDDSVHRYFIDMCSK